MSQLFRPTVYEAVKKASRQELEEIAERAIDLAWPPLFLDGHGRRITLASEYRAAIQAVLLRVLKVSV
jgi:hypothetical protein